jgi:NAD(P)-dependent dehydrogenase (short-subunit alcohol dehydrogenase family)
MGTLDGQVALVFGSSSGIGRATGDMLAGAGAVVALAARRAEMIEEAAQAIAARGGQALGLGADVSERAQVDAAVAATLERFGQIDILINAAGINIKNRKLDVLSDADYQRIIDINLTGAFYSIQAILPHMRSRGGGLIVQVSSVSGRWGDQSGAAYQASKHGLIGLCYATMFEERKHGIRVTALMPGLVDTPLLLNRPVVPSRETLDLALQPEDLAQACLFLAELPPRAYVPELIMLPGMLQAAGQTSS